MSVVAAAPLTPYKGLAPFEDSELDARLFFGRERETEIIVSNLLASRLTVLYGPSGVGKSSILRAAVARRLRDLEPDAAVLVLDQWTAEPTLPRCEGETFLILDQFEEYFLYHDEGPLADQLPALLVQPRVHILIALREDQVARLDAFRARVPSVFANRLRLGHLDESAARAAIVGPLDWWNGVVPDEDRVGIETALVDAVLEQVVSAPGCIEAPYLQLVLERLWETERAAGSRVLRLQTLHALGGTKTIVRDHLLRALARLPAEQQDVAANVFEHLVTPSGTKIAHRTADLAQYADVPEAALRVVLTRLSQDRLVHSVDGSDRYEIFHDVLGQPIRDWREQRRVDRVRFAARRRQRRLGILAAAALAALAVVAGLAVWAFSERSSAQAQTRHAHARELEARALQQLPFDPNGAVRLALAAAASEPGRAAEAVLRQALTADRLRLVKHASAPVRAVAASPRGDFLAAAIAGGRVLVLDAHNRRLVRTLGPRGAVAQISFGSGGRTLVTASPTGAANIWDVRTGRLLHRGGFAAGRTPDGGLRLVPLRGDLSRAIAHVQRLTVTPAGDLVAASVADKGGRTHPWLFAGDGTLLRALPQSRVRALAFSPDGQLLAVAVGDGVTRLWDTRAGRVVQRLREAKAGTDVVAFSPDGALFATGGDDGGVRVWDVATGSRTYLLVGHSNPVTALAWSPDGSVLASGSRDGVVLLWRIGGRAAAGSLAATLAGGDARVWALAFSPQGARLVTGGDDRAVRVWDARPNETLDLLGSGAGPALAARWAGPIIVAMWPHVVKTYDAYSRRLTHVLAGRPGERFTSLAVSADASVVVAGTQGGTTAVWDARSGARLPAPRADGPVLAVSASQRGDLVASGDGHGVVRVWSGRSGELRWTARQPGAAVGVAFSPTANRVVSAGARGTVIRSAADGRAVHLLPSPRGDVDADFSPDGRLVAAAGADANGRLWKADGRLYRVLRGHKRSLTDIAFSPDGRLVATSAADADVRVWNVDTGIGRALQRGAFGPISAVGFDSTGRWVAGAAPASVIMWSAETGRQLFYLRGHTDELTGVSFAPRAPAVVSSSLDGTVRTYTCSVCVDLPTLAHRARVRLARTR